jgi:hypothetical protein
MATQEERVGGSTLNEFILGRGWQQEARQLMACIAE